MLLAIDTFIIYYHILTTVLYCIIQYRFEGIIFFFYINTEVQSVCTKANTV